MTSRGRLNPLMVNLGAFIGRNLSDFSTISNSGITSEPYRGRKYVFCSSSLAILAIDDILVIQGTFSSSCDNASPTY
jgi:hypothetical protein